ncbi:MAG: nucleotidyl transferase AbiEii/AbiGii toxin family protein [Patescibacteria group bacterium]
MSTLFTQALDKSRLEVYGKLKEFSDGFVLAGGTALMLQINHRKSFDFDLFTERKLSKKLLPKAREIFGKDINVQVDNEDFLLFTTNDGVKLDFVNYPYPRLHQVITNNPISLFAVEDIATNKAHAIGRRSTWRDYVDIFFILKMKLDSLEKIIGEAKTRFGGEFNEKLFLEQLVYFKDLDMLPIDFLQEEYTTTQIQDFLQEEVEKYSQSRLLPEE